MKKQKILFIWDFHGVLEKDNEYAVQYICKKIMKEFGFNVKVYLKDMRRWYGRKWIEYFMNLTGERNKGKLKKMVERAREISREIVHKYIKPMDHARYVLKKIKNSGNTNVIISNTRQDRLEHFVEIVGIEKYVDHMVGVDGHTRMTFSTPKEKAREIQKLARDKRYARKIIIGDSEDDIQAGKIVSALTYLFLTNMNRFKVKKTKADRIISDLRDVLSELTV